MKARKAWLSPSLLFTAALASGCGASVPLPKHGPHAGDEAVLVPFPPPPANPEIIKPHNLGENAVWIDGEWRWTASAWVWQAGRWEVPYPNSYYAPPRGQRLADGRLLWFHGAWHANGDQRRPRRDATASPVKPPSPRSATGVPLPTLAPGAERIPEPPPPPSPPEPPPPAAAPPP